ncbi:MAG: GDP-L-fucose synthase [Alphaproteobacteria bacterium]|nr:GDP-L-fucose synthase [Alphaproteobacteria bacterium]
MSNKSFPLSGKKIWVAGHRGMVGSAIIRQLQKQIPNCEIINSDRLNLKDQTSTNEWVKENKPDAIFLAAAKVGGILANDTRPADFIYDNLMIEANIIEAARINEVEKLLLLGSTCIYPKLAEQPIKEESLLTGPLEPTNEWYAIAKIAGIKLCQAYRKQYGCNYISAMPTNLYGINDNFDLQSSHVLPALLRKIHDAKFNNAQTVEIWGTGSPRREFMFVDDLANALIFLMENYSEGGQVNVGTGTDVTIKELAEKICDIVGFKGKLDFDTSKPDGTPRKLTDTTKLNSMGWKATTSLEDGIKQTYDWYINNKAEN